MHRIIKLLLVIFLGFGSLNLQAQDDDESKGMLGQAAEAMRNRRFDEAEALYRILINENPDDMSLQQLLCHALINQKEFTECDSMLRRMVDKDSNQAGNYWYMGLSSERQRKDELAAYWFKYFIRKSTSVNAKTVKAWLHTGSAYRRLMHDSGINLAQCLDMIYHYSKYLELNPADPYAYEIRTFLDEIDRRKPAEGELLKWDEET